MTQPAIECQGLGKRYRIFALGGRENTGHNRFWTAANSPFLWLNHMLSRPGDDEVLWALKNLDLNIAPGEAVGIIGRNGSGKSTLLKLLSRITEPSAGWARVNGRVGTLLEVGTGFSPELTGRENLYLYGAILGMRRSEIRAKAGQILEFADLGRYVDSPLKRYSTGMRVRLGFAVAAHLEPEILLMDEVLAVGDSAFQKKCVDKMASAARGGATVLFVSHHMEVILGFCTRVIWLARGEKVMDGPVEEVIRAYMASVHSEAATPGQLARRTDRDGTGALRFTSLDIMDTEDRPLTVVHLGDSFGLALSYRTGGGTAREVETSVEVVDGLGRRAAVLSNQQTGQVFTSLPPEGRLTCRVSRLPLAPGRYTLNVKAKVGRELADYVESAGTLEVAVGDFYKSARRLGEHGAVFLDNTWESR